MAARALPANDPEFDQFYQVFPRKEARIDALRAWHQVRHMPGVSPESIIAGAKRFAARCEREGQEMKFVPLPASWLRAGRWSDAEPPPQKTQQATTGSRRATATHSENVRWETWKRIRGLPVASQAAKQGWAWNLKCRVLDGTIGMPEQITVSEFVNEQGRCENNMRRVQEKGEMLDPRDGKIIKLTEAARKSYLDGRVQLLLREAETAAEILNGGRQLPA